MKRAILLLTVLSATAFGQTAPSARTTNYNIRQWASGANPSADSLNANYALIDSVIRRPRYTIQDSIISTGTAIKLGSGDGTDNITIPSNLSVGNDLTVTYAIGASAVTSPSIVADSVVATANALKLGSGDGTDAVTVPGTFAVTKTSTFTGAVTFNGLAGTAVIRPTTSDGADSKSVSILGGGSGIPSRGAIIDVVGNEASASSGNIDMFAGDSANSKIRMYDRSTNLQLSIIDGGVQIEGTLIGAGSFKPDSIHSAGGARIDGFVDVNGTFTADSMWIGVIAINSSDIYNDGTAYTNPDYVFQDHWTGESKNPEYDGLRPLSEVEAYTKENHRLPGIKDEPTGIFKRADFVLENVEKLYLYLIAQEKELKQLRAEINELKRK